MTLLNRVRSGFLLFDGGMGTMIQPKMMLGELPEMLNLRLPDAVEDVHRQYLAAGCDVIETNTLNANRRKMEKAGHSVDEVVSAAVGCARRAIADCGREAYTALSMGSTGVMLEPLGDMTFAEARDMYAEMAAAGERAGADIILIETVSDLREIKAAVYGARAAAKLPVAVTVTFMENGRLLTGADAVTAFAAIEAFGADFIGMNCGLGPRQMLPMMNAAAETLSLPVLVNPNAGLPKLVDGKSVYAVGPDDFANDAMELVRMGARLIGGCCGTTPAHIAALSKLLENEKPIDIAGKQRSVITSGSRRADFSDGYLEIADIGSDDIDDMTDEAMDAEADIVMVKYSPLAEAVSAIQETVLKPMYLVADSPAEARAAMDAYNGKPLIGVARADNIDEYIAIARNFGAALAAENEDLRLKAAAVLGEGNAYVDAGDGRITSRGATVAGIA